MESPEAEERPDNTEQVGIVMFIILKKINHSYRCVTLFLFVFVFFFLYIPLLRSFLQHVGDAGIFVPQLLQLWPSLSSKRMHYSNERRSHVKCAAESYFVYVHLIRDSRMTFSTPASTSSQTSLILFTPTSHQLDPSDTRSNRNKWSTPLSNVTVPGLPRGEQLLNFEINSLLSPALFLLLLLQYDGNYMIPYYIFFFSLRSQEAGEDSAALYSTVNKA